MNSEKHGTETISGNVMIYIIIALALVGALTMTISRQNDMGSGENLNSERAELLTTKTVSYAGSVKGVIDQMMMSGTTVDSLNLALPNQTSFDAAPHYNKVFHPDGGGMGYESASADVFSGLTGSPAGGWYVSKTQNVQWTPGATADIILVAYNISGAVCGTINKRITGSGTIPSLTVTARSALMQPADGGGGQELNTTTCAACEGFPTLCVAGSDGVYAYYNIIVGR